MAFSGWLLSLDGTEQGSYPGPPDFRVGGRIFATLASVKKGYGSLMVAPEQQPLFVDELPEVSPAIPGGSGRMGMTHRLIAAAS